jgi:hypothetical protein
LQHSSSTWKPPSTRICRSHSLCMSWRAASSAARGAAGSRMTRPRNASALLRPTPRGGARARRRRVA